MCSLNVCERKPPNVFDVIASFIFPYLTLSLIWVCYILEKKNPKWLYKLLIKLSLFF